MKKTVLLAGLLLAASSWAQEARGGQGWSVLSGQTVGSNQTAITGAVGWPGISATLLQGVQPHLDVGVRLGFNYGIEGVVTSNVTPGLKVQGVLRVCLLDSARFNFGIEFAPGPFFYFYTRDTQVGLTLPLSAKLGIPAGAALMLHLGLDLPMYVTFGPGGRVVLPILVGAGAEYYIDQRLSVSFAVRMGPALNANGPYASTPLALQAQVGVALKL
jgi:hypothetical protein